MGGQTSTVQHNGGSEDVDNEQKKRKLDTLTSSQSYDTITKTSWKTPSTTSFQSTRSITRVRRSSRLNVPSSILSAQDEVEARHAFSLIDVDGKGVITTKDIERVLKTLGQTPMEKKIQELMREVDQNSDGTIEFLEFCNLFADFKRQEISSQLQEQWPNSSTDVPLSKSQYLSFFKKIGKNFEDKDAFDFAVEIENADGLVEFSALLEAIWKKYRSNILRRDELTGQFILVDKEKELVLGYRKEIERAEKSEREKWDLLQDVEFVDLDETARKYVINIRKTIIYLSQNLTDRETQLKTKEENLLSLNRRVIKLEKDLEYEKLNQAKNEKALRQRINEEERRALGAQQEAETFARKIDALQKELEQERSLRIQTEHDWKIKVSTSTTLQRAQDSDLLPARLRDLEKELDQERARRLSLERELKEKIQDQVKKTKMEFMTSEEYSKQLKEVEVKVTLEKEKAGATEANLRNLESTHQVLLVKRLQLEESLSGLAKQNTELTNENTQLANQLNHLSNQNKHLNAQINDLTNQNKNLLNQVADLKQEIQSTSQSYVKITTNLEAQLAAERDENNKKTAEIERLLLQLNDLKINKQKEIELLLDEIRKKDELIRDLEAKAKQFWRSLTEAESNLKTVQHELTTQIHQNNLVQKELESVKEENQTLREASNDAAKEIEAISATYSRKLIEIENRSSLEISNLKKTITEHEGKVNVLYGELVLERQKIAEERETSKASSSQVTTFELKFESLLREVDEIKAEKSRVDQEKIELLDLVNHLQQDLKAKEEELDRLLREFESTKYALSEEKRLRLLLEESAQLALEKLKAQHSEQITSLTVTYESKIESLVKRVQEEENRYRKLLLDLQAERDKLKEQIDKYNKLLLERSEIDQALKALQLEIEKLNQIREHQRREIEALNGENVKQLQQLHALKDQLVKLEIQISSLKEENLTLKGDREAILSQNQKLRAEIEELKKELRDLSFRFSSISLKYDELVTRYEKEKQEWSLSIEQYQRTIERLRKDEEKLALELRLLQEEYDKLRKEFEVKVQELKVIRSEFALKIKSLEDKILVLTADLQKRDQRIVQLETNFRELFDENGKLKRELEVRTKELQSVKNELIVTTKTLNDRINSLTIDLQKREQRISQLEVLREELEKKLSIQIRTNQEQSILITSLKAEIEQLKKRIAELEEIIRNLREERAQLLKALADKEAKLQNLRRIQSGLKGVYAELQNVEAKFGDEIDNLFD